MKHFTRKRMNLLGLVAIAAIAGPLSVFVAGCGAGPGESESNMTSFTSSESKGRHRRTLQRSEGTDVSHPDCGRGKRTSSAHAPPDGRGGVRRICNHPRFRGDWRTSPRNPRGARQFVQAGQPLLTVTSPDYSAARSAYIKAKDSYALSERLYTRAKILRPRRHLRGRSPAGGIQPNTGSRGQESSADALRALGLKDPEAVLKPSCITAQIPVIAPVTGEIVERLVGPGQLLVGGTTQCFTISKYQHRLGSS